MSKSTIFIVILISIIVIVLLTSSVFVRTTTGKEAINNTANATGELRSTKCELFCQREFMKCVLDGNADCDEKPGSCEYTIDGVSTTIACKDVLGTYGKEEEESPSTQSGLPTTEQHTGYGKEEEESPSTSALRNLYPENEAIGVELTPTLSCSEDPEADKYIFYIKQEGQTIFVEIKVDESKYTIDLKPEYNTLFYWYVESYKGETKLSTSDTWTFTTAP